MKEADPEVCAICKETVLVVRLYEKESGPYIIFYFDTSIKNSLLSLLQSYNQSSKILFKEKSNDKN